jgi:drug/metabolite transporter (DMT)-like permease
MASPPLAPPLPPSSPSSESVGGFAFGAIVSICCDVVIAVGLGLQKTGHMRLSKEAKESGEETKGVFTQPVWVLGLVCMISGEIGNLAAYGDPNTPTAVVTAVGCIGVVANLVISTVFLKEQFRLRDVLGASFVVAGVVLVTFFAPNNSVPLTGEQLNMYLVQWGAIAIYLVYGTGIVVLYFAVQRLGHTNVVWYLLLSSLIGAFTVMSSKPVSTFAFLSIEGLATGKFDDRLAERADVTVATQALCDASDGFGIGATWQSLSAGDATFVNRTHGCVFAGLGQLDQPTMWLGSACRMWAPTLLASRRELLSRAESRRARRRVRGVLPPLRSRRLDRHCCHAGQVPQRCAGTLLQFGGLLPVHCTLSTLSTLSPSFALSTLSTLSALSALSTLSTLSSTNPHLTSSPPLRPPHTGHPRPLHPMGPHP